MSRILVTGSRGYIGRALCTHLMNCGFSVTGMARRSSDDYGEVSLFPVIQADLAELHAGPDALPAGLDAVVHLAGRAHESGESPGEAAYVRDNVQASRQLAEVAIRAGVRRLVFVSSIGVYGRRPSGGALVNEATSPEPVEIYAQSKLAAERLLGELLPAAGVELVIVRPALVVGAYAPGNLARLGALARRGWPLPVPWADNARSFIGLRSLVDLLRVCLTHSSAAGSLINATDPQPVSTREVITWIREGMGRPARLVRLPGRLMRLGAAAIGQAALHDKLFGDLLVGSTRAREVLGWQPVCALPDEFRDLGRSLA